MSNILIDVENKLSMFSKTMLYSPENNALETTTVFDFLKNLNVIKQNIIDTLYPIGSIYFVANDVYETQGESILPWNQFPGTSWEEIHRTLIGDNDTYPLGSEGGEVWHTLTIDEIPSHTHKYTKNKPANNYLYSGSSGWDYGNGTDFGHNDYASTYRGGSQPHLNLQPYEKVLIYKRVA